MRTPQERSFSPVNDDELPADVRDFTRLFRSEVKTEEPKAGRPAAEGPRPPLA